MLFTARNCTFAMRVALVAGAMLCAVSLEAAAQSKTRAKSASSAQPSSSTTAEANSDAEEEPDRTSRSSSKPSATRKPRVPAMFASGARTSRSYVPSHQRTSGTSLRVLQQNESVAPEGEMVAEEIFSEPEMLVDGHGHLTHEPMMSDCGCEGPCDHGHDCLIPCPTNCWDNLELFGGAQGFTGPLNRGETGSFGFYEGVNWGAPIPCLCTGELGMQAGMRASHSHFSGAEFSDDDRTQIFVTAGVFRRVDWGLQGGVVMDYLSEDWYLEADLAQLRGELSWVYPCRHEVGFWFTSNTQEDEVTSRVFNGQTTVETPETLRATDLFAFFYRHRIDESGAANGRLFAGFTGESDGFLGAEVNVPLNDCWAIQSGFAYLIPEENDHVEESWNFALGIAWRPGGGFQCGKDYYRPLFDVAHNGTFMVDRE